MMLFSYSCLPAFYRTGFASMYTVPKLIRTSSPRIPIRYESPELIQQFYHSKKLTTVPLCQNFPISIIWNVLWHGDDISRIAVSNGLKIKLLTIKVLVGNLNFGRACLFCHSYYLTVILSTNELTTTVFPHIVSALE